MTRHGLEFFLSIAGVSIGSIAAFIGAAQLWISIRSFLREKTTQSLLLNEQSLGSFGEVTMRLSGKDLVQSLTVERNLAL